MTFNTVPFIDLIQDRTGLVLNESRINELENGIRRRMAARGIQSAPEYYDLIQRDRIEFFKLVNLFTINETYFFRESHHIDLMTRRLIPGGFASLGPEDTIRIMSAGCSTGEEPYSLAIAVTKAYGFDNRKRFFIAGADIDGDAINRARTGVFTRHSFRAPVFSFSDTYFNEIGRNQYQIKPEIREMVHFQTVNLTTPPYPESLWNMDVIFYRNVSIYFSPDVQRRVFENLAAILKENGYLIVSSTETLSHSFGVLDLVEMDGHFIFQKPASGLAPQKTPSISEAAEPGYTIPQPFEAPLEDVIQPVASQAAPQTPAEYPAMTETPPESAMPAEYPHTPDASYETALCLAREKKYSEALERLDRITGSKSNDTRSALLRAEILINLNRTAEAENICQSIIQSHPLCMESYLLAGIIAKQKRDLKDAAKLFRRALFVNGKSWLARFHLSEIHQAWFENERARKGYESVMESLASGGYVNHGLTLFNASFSMNDIMQLCRLRIDQMGAARRAHGV